MGFQGSLATVNLADILQSLAVNAQTGTLAVRSGDRVRHIWFREGNVALLDVEHREGPPPLLRRLVGKGILSSAQAEQLSSRANASRQPIADLIRATGLVSEEDLDLMSLSLIEDAVCEVFEWPSGEFSFSDGEPAAALSSTATIEVGGTPVPTANLVMEATRRQDEWLRIREVIPSDAALLTVDNDGRSRLAELETDPEMLKVLRFLDGRRSIVDIADATGLSRFDVSAIAAQFILAGIVRLRDGLEILDDALALRDAEDPRAAWRLLKQAAETDRSPDILLPLAELSAELRETPLAVELFLELVQQAQEAHEPQQALLYLDALISLSPDDPELRLDRANLLAELEHVDDAAQAYLTAARDYLQRRDTDAAIDCCHRARDLQPRAAEPHRLLARAYLLDGQTDNAVVEYKTLWHALLTSNSPRRALSELETILGEDCKFASVKEQVLAHARGSDAVKTSQALRWLIYACMVVVLGGAAWAGKHYYDHNVVLAKALSEVQAAAKRLDQAPESANFASLIRDLEKWQDVTADADFMSELTTTLNRLRKAWLERGNELYRACEDRIVAGELDSASGMLDHLREAYAEPLGPRLEELTQRLRLAQGREQISSTYTRAQQQWQDMEWQSAIAELEGLLASQKRLPSALREELQQQLNAWQSEASSAASLLKRAEYLLREQGASKALPAFVAAAKGQGEAAQQEARARLLAVEGSYAKELTQSIARFSAQGDAVQTFASLDQLQALVKTANASKPQELLATVQLPCVFTVNDHYTTLLITMADGSQQQLQAPAGRPGPWSATVYYPATAGIVVAAQRRGFTSLTDRRIDASGRTLHIPISLARGPRWRAELPSPAQRTLLSGRGQIVAILRNNAMASVDLKLGSVQSAELGEDVGTLSSLPFVFRDVVYATIGGRMVACDITTRKVLWSWPPVDDPTWSGVFAGAPWVQEHELIQNRIQIFSGTADGRVLSLAVDPPQSLLLYPPTRLENAISGPLMVDHYQGLVSTLFVPAGNRLHAFDASSVGERSPLKQRYRLELSAEINFAPVRASILGNAALLVLDANGAVVAIDADPTVHGSPVQHLASWALEGQPAGAPAVNAESTLALIALASGSVVALDCQRSGQLQWRYPESGRMGRLLGSPVIGQFGCYVVDDQGLLTCLETASGRKLWDFNLGSPASTPVLAKEGRLLVATTGGSLFCFEESEP